MGEGSGGEPGHPSSLKERLGVRVKPINTTQRNLYLIIEEKDYMVVGHRPCTRKKNLSATDKVVPKVIIGLLL
jgi:hypothetical protein